MNRAERRRRERENNKAKRKEVKTMFTIKDNELEKYLNGSIANYLLDKLDKNVEFVGVTCEEEIQDLKKIKAPASGKPISCYFALTEAEEEEKYNIITMKELFLSKDKEKSYLVFDSAFELAKFCYFEFIGIEDITNLTDKALYLIDSDPISDKRKICDEMFVGYLREKIKIIPPANNIKSDKKGRKKKVNINQEIRQLKILFWDLWTNESYVLRRHAGEQEDNVINSISEFYRGEAVQDDNFSKPYFQFESYDAKRVKELLEDK